MPDYPQVNIDGIGVFFLVEFQPSFELSFLACDGDFTGEAHELQLPTRDRSLAYPTTIGAEPNAPCVVYIYGGDEVTLQLWYIPGIVGRPGSPIEFAHSSIGADPLVPFPVYGDSIDIVAYKARSIGNIGCPGAAVESAHCGIFAKQVVTPLVVSIGTPSKPLLVGAVYGNVPDMIAR